MTGIHSTGVDLAVTKLVKSAREEAQRIRGPQRWVLLSLYAEIHRRAAAEIEALARQAEAAPRAARIGKARHDG